MTAPSPMRACLAALLAVASIACDASEGSANKQAAKPATATDSKAESKSEAAPPAKTSVALTPADAKARLTVANANLTMDNAAANGQRLRALSCAASKRPMLGAVALIGAIAEKKPALDACAAEGDAAVMTWTASGGAIEDLEIEGASSTNVDACLTAALAGVKSPFDATCAAILQVGEAGGADTAAAALLGEP